MKKVSGLTRLYIIFILEPNKKNKTAEKLNI
jgi:hypothetical protein